MSPVTRAIVWQQWRENKILLLVIAGVIGYLESFDLAMPADLGNPLSYASYMFVWFSQFMFVLRWQMKGPVPFGWRVSRHLLSIPVTTRRIVTTLLLCRTAFVSALFTLALIVPLFRGSQVLPPSIVGVLVVSTICFACFQMLLWVSPTGLALLLVLASFALVIIPEVVSAYLSTFVWPILGYALLLLLPVILLPAVTRAISRQRHGAGMERTAVWSQADHEALERVRIRPLRFRGPWHAQIWFFWRTFGLSHVPSCLFLAYLFPSPGSVLIVFLALFGICLDRGEVRAWRVRPVSSAFMVGSSLLALAPVVALAVILVSFRIKATGFAIPEMRVFVQGAGFPPSSSFSPTEYSTVDALLLGARLVLVIWLILGSLSRWGLLAVGGALFVVNALFQDHVGQMFSRYTLSDIRNLSIWFMLCGFVATASAIREYYEAWQMRRIGIKGVAIAFAVWLGLAIIVTLLWRLLSLPALPNVQSMLALYGSLALFVAPFATATNVVDRQQHNQDGQWHFFG